MGVIKSKDIEKVFKIKENEYQTIIQSSFDGFWVCDLKGKILEVNKTFCDILGYTKEELLTMLISDFEVNENPEDAANHIQKLIKTGSDRFETKQRTKDERILYIQIKATYHPDDGGISNENL